MDWILSLFVGLCAGVVLQPVAKAAVVHVVKLIGRG